MKFMKRAGIYQGSSYNVTFNPETMEAHSYKWWKFVAVIEGKVVFNNFRYSPTTGNHQRKVRRLLEELGIKIDLMLPVPGGLQTVHSLEECILVAEEHLCDSFIADTLRKQAAYYRRKEKTALKFKEQLDSITLEDIEKHRTGLSLVTPNTEAI